MPVAILRRAVWGAGNLAAVGTGAARGGLLGVSSCKWRGAAGLSPSHFASSFKLSWAGGLQAWPEALSSTWGWAGDASLGNGRWWWLRTMSPTISGATAGRAAPLPSRLGSVFVPRYPRPSPAPLGFPFRATCPPVFLQLPRASRNGNVIRASPQPRKLCACFARVSACCHLTYWAKFPITTWI